MLFSIQTNLDHPTMSIFAKFLGLKGSLNLKCLSIYLDIIKILSERR